MDITEYRLTLSKQNKILIERKQSPAVFSNQDLSEFEGPNVNKPFVINQRVKSSKSKRYAASGIADCNCSEILVFIFISLLKKEFVILSDFMIVLHHTLYNLIFYSSEQRSTFII